MIEQDNKGYSGDRNTGIDFVTGRYLMFLDSDYVIVPNGIEVLLNRAFTYDADIVEGGFRWIHPNGKYIDKPCSDEVKGVSNPLGILDGFFVVRYIKEKFLVEYDYLKDIGSRIRLMFTFYFGKVNDVYLSQNWYTDIIRMRMVRVTYYRTREMKEDI